MRLPLPRTARGRLVLPTLVVAAALIALTATGAEAAPARHSTDPHRTHAVVVHPASSKRFAPGAPTGVIATGTADSVTLRWSAPAASSAARAVVAYSVSRTPSAGQRSGGHRLVGAHATSVTFSGLTAGTAYSLSIRADGLRGHSATVEVGYTPVAERSVFALDGSGALVRVPATGGAPVVVETGVTSYDVDPQGDAFAVTGVGVVEVSASGAVTRLVAGDTSATDLQLDSSGDVYLLEGTDIVRIDADTHTATTVASEPVAPVAFTVQPSGAFSLLEARLGTHSIVSYPAGGGAATTTVLTDSPYYGPISGAFDAKGNLYYAAIATGASGSIDYSRIAAGQTGSTPIGGSYGRYGIGLTDDEYFLQSATWCTSYGIGTGTCTPDYTVSSITVTSDTGVTTSVPVSGLSLSVADTRPFSAGTSVTSDSDGTIYIGSAAGLVTYAETGGAPTTLAAGSFTNVKVTR